MNRDPNKKKNNMLISGRRAHQLEEAIIPISEEKQA